jgi:uncharacterized repeat protein (TIGR01451 family)
LKLAKRPFAVAFDYLQHALIACLCCVLSVPAFAAGTAVGTLIENTANISYDIAGVPLTAQSNTTTIVVAERINVQTTLQSPQVLVSANDVARALLFAVTNTGNGTEQFVLSIDNNIVGDDFDPVAAVPAIYFDSDGSGDFNAGDQAYTPGLNNPALAPDESVSVFIVNDIPGTVLNGNIGRSRLIATAATGSGIPGTVFAGQGDGGVDAVAGSTGGEASGLGEYLVSDVLINIIKSQAVLDPFGGTAPVPGATLRYTITVDVASTGVATASVFRDAVPPLTTFVPNSITLNAAPITDAADADAGELDISGAPTIVVRLGDLTQADGAQTIVFEVTID